LVIEGIQDVTLEAVVVSKLGVLMVLVHNDSKSATTEMSGSVSFFNLYGQQSCVVTRKRMAKEYLIVLRNRGLLSSDFRLSFNDYTLVPQLLTK
jgi:hypothetical protein